MSAVVRVGKKCTIVIPKSIRKRIGIKEGTKLLLITIGKSIVIEPLPDDPFSVLEKIITYPYREEVDEKKAMEWIKRRAGS